MSDILKDVKLFEGISAPDLPKMLNCLNAKTVYFSKGEFVLSAGDKTEFVGVVLDGVVHIVKEDADGNRVLVDALAPGNFFGEALCCAGIAESPVSVVADTAAEVMLLQFQRILQVCSDTCVYHARLVENMLHVIAQKNLLLQNRIDFLSKKTLRGRIMAYLETVAPRRGVRFTIPFSREELADFLCTDRSALSRELGNMREEGMIRFKKNQFTMMNY